MLSKIKRLLAKLALAACSVLVTLLLFELYLRYFGHVIEVGPVFTTYVEGYGLGNKRSLSCVRIAPEYRTTVTTNQLRLRGAEVTQHKPEHTTRVLCLGDSFTFGKGVEDRETYSFILQQELNSTSDGNDYEVLNAGVVSYGTANEYLYLKKQGLTFDPDLLVLQFCENDFGDNASSGLYYLDDRGSLVDASEPYKNLRTMVALYNKIPLPAQHILDYSYFFNYVRLRLNVKILWPTASSAAQDKTQEEYRLTKALLEALFRLCQESGISVVLLAFDLNDSQEREVMAAASAANVAVLNLGNLHENHPELYYLSDGHWNSQGHAYVSGRLFAFVAQHGFLTGSGVKPQHLEGDVSLDSQLVPTKGGKKTRPDVKRGS